MINKDSLVCHVLNGQTKEQYISLLIFGFLGLLVSILVELLRAKNKIKEKGGFSFAIWFTDNWARTLLSILVIVIGVLYAPDLGKGFGLDLQVGNKGALITGFMTDKLIEALISLQPQVVLSNIFAKKE